MGILRVIATVLAGPCLVVGCIWILQGFNLLPGSFMTGDIKWAVFGIILLAVGGLLTWWVNRKR